VPETRADRLQRRRRARNATIATAALAALAVGALILGEAHDARPTPAPAPVANPATTAVTHR
jgi:hypothetical protein